MMLPQSYEIPAAVLIALAGALACFAGHRLFRIVLAVFGFILGAMIASSVMGLSNTTGMVVAALLGGLAGALILIFAYFVGIALVGAGLGAAVAHFGWRLASGSGDPPVLLVIGLAIAGAVGAMIVQRHVIVLTTAFVGAWTMIVGTLAAVGERGAVAAKSTSSVWILYPVSPAPGRWWIPYVWVVLGVVGAAVQFGFTRRRR
jgi:hypothetical protein